MFWLAMASLEPPPRNGDDVVRLKRHIRLLPVADGLQVDLEDLHLSGLGVEASQLNVVAPVTRQPAGEGDGGGRRGVSFDRVAAGPGDFALYRNLLLLRDIDQVAVAKGDFQVYPVLR